MGNKIKLITSHHFIACKFLFSVFKYPRSVSDTTVWFDSKEHERRFAATCTFTLRSWTSSTFIAKVFRSIFIDVRFPFSVALLACERVNLSRCNFALIVLLRSSILFSISLISLCPGRVATFVVNGFATNNHSRYGLGHVRAWVTS